MEYELHKGRIFVYFVQCLEHDKCSVRTDGHWLESFMRAPGQAIISTAEFLNGNNEKRNEIPYYWLSTACAWMRHGGENEGEKSSGSFFLQGCAPSRSYDLILKTLHRSGLTLPTCSSFSLISRLQKMFQGEPLVFSSILYLKYPNSDSTGMQGKRWSVTGGWGFWGFQNLLLVYQLPSAHRGVQRVCPLQVIIWYVGMYGAGK